MAVEEESGRSMRTHSHSKRTNGKYAHSSKISQHNLWLLKGVVNKKPTIKELPTELAFVLDFFRAPRKKVTAVLEQLSL